MATIDNAYGKGVVYTASIDLGAQKPLDSRIAVQTAAERDAHVTGNRAFPGMQVYVAEDEKTYIYNGTAWDVLVTDADLTEGIDVKIAAATTGKIGGILSGNDVEVDTSGNATVKQADKLRTARNVTLTGDATGTSTFDGSADLSIAVDVPGLDGKVAIMGQTGDVDLTEATVKVKTLSKAEAQSADGTTAASIEFVSDVVDARIAQSDAMIYKGTVADKTTITDANTTAKTGWTYRVTADIDFTSDAYIVSDVKQAHAGDLIICRTDGSVETPATWDIVKHNDDGQVIGPESSVADRIVTFAGATGKVVKDSGKTLADISSEIDSDVSAAKTELIGTSNDASTVNTIYGAKKYAEEAAQAVSDDVTELTSKVNANTGKLADVDTTVGGLIDSKINTAVGENGTIATAINIAITNGVAANGVIDNAIDSVISTGLNDGGVIDNKIDSLISDAVGSLETYEAYMAEEVEAGISTWAGFNN